MSDTQFYVAVAIAPMMSIIIMLAGLLWNNAVMNARFNDMQARMNDGFANVYRRMDDMRDMLRAEMARNHSELLARIAEIESRR